MKLHDRKPNIENLYRVLRCETPERPTLFEFFMNTPLYESLVGEKAPENGGAVDGLRFLIKAFTAAGYDYTTTPGSDFHFPIGSLEHKSTRSLNEGFVITDEASFKAYAWPDPESFDYSRLADAANDLPEGMKFMVQGPSGVLENVTSLVGYDNLCYMIYEEPDLAKAIFDAVGSRLLRYYEIAAEYESVGLLMSNDDWGFNTQTFLSPADMRRFVFPWHKKIVEVGHKKGMPVVLHSCGYFDDVMDDVIEMGYDGKHSYEDAIRSVEDSYEKWTGRIAILGGIDLDFIVRSSEEEITKRSGKMLERAATRGGYALGTGNSVPEYVPQDHYLAMIRAALVD